MTTYPLLYKVELPQHYLDINEHDGGSASKDKGIAFYGLCRQVGEALGHIGKQLKPASISQTSSESLYEGSLPPQCELINWRTF